MIPRPPRSTRTDPLFPYTRSSDLLEPGAGGVDDIAVLLHREGAVAGIADLVVGAALHREEAFAGDGEVQRLVGGFDGALRELLADALGADALARDLRRGLHRRGGEDDAEHGLALLEGGRIAVGEFVRRGSQVGLGGLASGKGGVG